MLPSWFRQTITRIRPGVKYSRGSAIPDWDNAEAEAISGCSVQPSSISVAQDGRVLSVDKSYTVYMPATADVREGDRIEYNGDIYLVVSVHDSWLSPTGRLDNKQATIERWSG